MAPDKATPVTWPRDQREADVMRLMGAGLAPSSIDRAMGWPAGRARRAVLAAWVRERAMWR